MKSIKFILFTSLVLLVFQYCSPSEGTKTCTDEFVFYTVTVMDPDAIPADSVQLEVSNKDDGKEYPCDEYLCNEKQAGTYVIMHDGLREEISNIGETVLVEGIKDDLRFSEEFVFREGECHMQKIAGPDTVSLSSN